MKKLVIVLIFVLVFNTANVWALEEVKTYTGVGLIGLGAVVLLIPTIVDIGVGDSGGNNDSNGVVNTTCYITGGIIAALGLGLFIWGLVDDSAYAKIENNDVLKHVSFDTRGNDLYLGVRFKF